MSEWTEAKIAEQLAVCEAATTPVPWRWDGTTQGAHLGDTLICLDDDYEGHQEDMAYVEESCTNYPSALRELRVLRRALEILAQYRAEYLAARGYASPTAETEAMLALSKARKEVQGE